MMKQDKETKNTKICPVCGTRVSENATRCLVCGAQLSATASTKKQILFLLVNKTPEIRLKLPVAIALGLIFIGLLVGLAFILMQTPDQTQGAAAPEENTPTSTATITLTPTTTLTPTPMPTWTPLPPIEYVVKNTDYCSSIAALFGVSVQSIIRETTWMPTVPSKKGMCSKFHSLHPPPHHSLHPPQPRPLNRTAKRLRSQWKLAGH